jgi:hypothetical protein
MTEDEAETVAALAAQCAWGARRSWGPVMRYGRLFTPGTDAGGGYPMIPAWAGRNAYRRAADSGLLYAEGYACRPSGITTYSAWCLDGETVVDPGFSEPGTAYFGVAMRPGFVRRVHDARRSDNGSDMFSYVFIGPLEAMGPPLDPAADIVAGLGRDIPPRVRDWALTADRPSGEDRVAPAWVMEELLPEREDLSPQLRRPRPRRGPGPGTIRVGRTDAVQFGPWEDLGYRRPPVTASFEDLRRRGLPEVLFVHSFLPEGVTVCDVNVFAAMIAEAYNPPRTLLVDEPDVNGNQQCRGVGNNGIWEWAVVSPGRRPGWQMTLAPERDGQRQATIEARTVEHGHSVIGPTLATFPISTSPAGQLLAGDPVQFGSVDAMGYRRPPVAVSFDDLSQRGLPRVLFVNGHLPEGITVCGIDVFAAMIEEAYQAAGPLHYVHQDEHGNEWCVGLGGTGIWEWWVVRAGKPINGERYASPHQSISRILFAPEKDGKRVCTVELNGHPGHEPEDDSPITFTIDAGRGRMLAPRPAPATRPS